MNRIVLLGLGVALTLSACTGRDRQARETGVQEVAVAETLEPLSVSVARLARTVNFGNALEAPQEGEWGMTLEERFFGLVKDGGFTAVRLPIRWNAHAASAAPYTIEPKFLERIDWAVQQANARDLGIILDFHHYDELMTAPTAHRERFLGIWKQVAERYRGASSRVYFEVHNEPNGALGPLWNEYQNAALAVIRKSNPTRPVIVGGIDWNSIGQLENLKLPASDQRLIATFHFYAPFEFTHQGAEWASPIPPTGVIWPQPGVRARWDNWSWQTAVDGSSGALRLTFQAGWAGFSQHRAGGVSGVQSVRIRTDRAVRLRVSCLAVPDGEATASAPVTTQPGVSLTVPLSSCGNPATLVRLNLQNDTPDPQPSFTLSELALVRSSGTESLLTDARSELSGQLEQARAWSQRSGRPLFMGEFGAYGKGDLASRVRWTRFVREEAEKRGIRWGYWEFGAGFGVYDRVKKAWNSTLLEALTGKKL